MHALFFSFKRVHHRILAHGRNLLDRVHITPARFDMLFAIRQLTECIPTTQRDLRKKLGMGVK